MKKQIKVLTIALVIGILVSMLASAVYAADGLTVQEWNDFFSTCGNNEIGMHMFADASCKNPLNPEYVKVEMNIEKFAEAPVDAWITMGLVKSFDPAMNVVTGNPQGLAFMLRNSGGTLNLFACKNGVSNTLIEAMNVEGVKAIGDLTFEFMRDAENNTWHLYVNGIKVDASNKVFEGVKAEDFTDANGKTYVAFAAYDNANDAMNNRVWTVKKISDQKPQQEESTSSTDSAVQNEVKDTNATNPKTSDQQVYVYILMFAVSLAVIYISSRKKPVSCK